jgi:hypothetical protein
MRRLPSSFVLLAACGPAHVFHKDPEAACKDVTLAGQEDVAAAAGCSAIDSLTLRTGMALDLKPLGRLTTIRKALAIGPSVGFSELTLPRLQSVGSIRIVGNGNLAGIFLPALVRVAKIEIEGNVALTTVSMPKLATVDARLAIADNAVLEMVDVSALGSAGEVAIAKNPKLSVIEGTLPALQAARPTPKTPDTTPTPDTPPTP